MTKYNLIAAVAKNYVIGDKNKIPWYIPEDFKLFKKKTSGNIIIMGKNTWESLPIKPLPNRINIVLSRNDLDLNEFKETYHFKNIEEALEFSKKFNKEIFIIGGAKLYEQTIENADKLYISHLKEEFQGDTYFPKFDKENYKIIEEIKFEKFIFKIYKKIK